MGCFDLLPFEQQKEVLSNLFSKEGALRFSMGRIPMNAMIMHGTGIVVMKCPVIFS